MMERTMRDERYPQRRRTPSFSSSLLDAIYRSIDESKSNLDEDQQLGLFKETTTTHTPKQSNSSYNQNNNRVSVEKSCNKEKMNLRRAVMVEDWMEKQSTQSSQFVNSTSSSSESTSGAVFSSSETDTTHKPKQRTRPKSMKNNNNNSEQKPKRESGGGFARTKLRALKIYGEKVKQPISPASRIASFLSSIFNTGNVKKAKMCYVGAVEDVSFEHKSKSPCFSSSTSSFSRRSCMSKTPSSAKAKRSVRFYPVSVVLGEEDSQPISGHRYTYDNDPSLLPLPKMTRGSSSIKDVKKKCVMAKESGFMKGYQSSSKGTNNQFCFKGFYNNGHEGDEDDEDEDDDALSYSSSDLFELDHLIGAGRYQEELPVYETTNLETNKAIANGLHL